MFSFAIVIFSILLVAALAAATMYYAGGRFTEGYQESQAAKTMVEGQQVLAAAQMYVLEQGQQAMHIEELVPTYLSVAPKGWEATNGLAYLAGVEEATCRAFNAKLGVSTVPTCSDPAFAGIQVCCQDDQTP